MSKTHKNILQLLQRFSVPFIYSKKLIITADKPTTPAGSDTENPPDAADGVEVEFAAQEVFVAVAAAAPTI